MGLVLHPTDQMAPQPRTDRSRRPPPGTIRPLGIRHKRAAYGRVRGAGAGLAAASGCCQTLRFAAFVPRGEVGKLLPRLSSCPASGPRAGAPQSGSSPAPGLPGGGDGGSEGTETQQRNT